MLVKIAGHAHTHYPVTSAKLIENSKAGQTLHTESTNRGMELNCRYYKVVEPGPGGPGGYGPPYFFDLWFWPPQISTCRGSIQT